eukprot:scaffold48383_cov60-Phaeocystis_antarctica.AAC.1
MYYVSPLLTLKLTCTRSVEGLRGAWGKAPPCTVPPLLYNYCAPTIMNTRPACRLQCTRTPSRQSPLALAASTEPSD